MNHIAIDLGSKKSQVCIRNEKAELVRLFEMEPPSRVVMEASSEAFHVARQAQSRHQVKVVPSVLSKALAVGARGIKTDQRDAQALSQASCVMELPEVYIPPLEIQEQRELLHARRVLVQQRTALINSLRGWARCRLLAIKSGMSSTFSARLREAINDKLPTHVEARLSVLETVNHQIVVLTNLIREKAKQNKTCQLLQTVPGVGPLVSLAFMSTLGAPGRFQTAATVMSYIGLTPGENSSGERQQKTRITKAGTSELRALLVLAAQVAMQKKMKDEPMKQWALRLSDKRGKQKAVVALARKLAGILWAMWKTGKPYEPVKAAREQNPAPTAN